MTTLNTCTSENTKTQSAVDHINMQDKILYDENIIDLFLYNFAKIFKYLAYKYRFKSSFIGSLK